MGSLIAGLNTQTENLLTTDGMAVVIQPNLADAGNVLNRDIRLRLRATDQTECNPHGLLPVHQSHPGYMPLAYVPLFPKGNYG